MNVTMNTTSDVDMHSNDDYDTSSSDDLDHFMVAEIPYSEFIGIMGPLQSSNGNNNPEFKVIMVTLNSQNIGLLAIEKITSISDKIEFGAWAVHSMAINNPEELSPRLLRGAVLALFLWVINLYNVIVEYVEGRDLAVLIEVLMGLEFIRIGLDTKTPGASYYIGSHVALSEEYMQPIYDKLF